LILTDRLQKLKARFPKKIKDYQKPFLKNSAFCQYLLPSEGAFHFQEAFRTRIFLKHNPTANYSQ
jgi:hypothetical protein